MKGKNQDIQDIIDFVTAYDSYLSGLLDSGNSDQKPEAIINPQEQEQEHEYPLLADALIMMLWLIQRQTN